MLKSSPDTNRAAAMATGTNIRYWTDDDRERNFGDYLSDYISRRLFYRIGLPAIATRIIGSTIDDGIVAADLLGDLTALAPEARRVIFWGCGLRRPDGLSPAMRKQVAILAVRGPLSRSHLGLGLDVPIGDPGLLLPALYRPSSNAVAAGRRILVPHFNDRRSDAELLVLSGCDVVLRPGITDSLEAVERFIDQIISAEFVLAGALHAAITAAAYGTPFGYWDSGCIDTEFKWHDFAASVDIPCIFHSAHAPAATFYEEAIRPALRLPRLWPLLTVAPYPVRQDMAARVLAEDFSRYGPGPTADATPIQALLADHIAALTPREREKAELQQELLLALAALDSCLSGRQSYPPMGTAGRQHSQLRALGTTLRAIGYLLFPSNPRRRRKRDSMLRVLSARERRRAVGYLLLPYNQRRRAKKQAMMAALHKLV